MSANPASSDAGGEIGRVASGAATGERMQRWEDWLALRHEPALEPELEILDAHHHLWDRGGHTYLPAQLLSDAAGGHRLVGSVYVECLSGYRRNGAKPLQPVGETECVVSMLEGSMQTEATGLCAGIVGFADLSLGAAVDEVLDAHLLAGKGRFCGVRYATAWDADPAIHRVYPTHAGMLREASVLAGARRLAARSLSLDLWLYFLQLDDVAALARACPELSIVVDHCGGVLGIGPYAGRRDEVFAQWRQSIRALRSLGNVSVKFGGLAMPLAGFAWRAQPVPPHSEELARAWQPYFDVCLDTFGAERCMFESNFPVDRTGCTYTSLWNAFKRLAAPLASGERAALCADTAARVYRL